MESVLTRQSRIAPRTAVAKPLSAAVAIGTGGSFGSGTSGGTLAPVLLVGGSFGALLGGLVDHVLPGAQLAPEPSPSRRWRRRSGRRRGRPSP